MSLNVYILNLTRAFVVSQMYSVSSDVELGLDLQQMVLGLFSFMSRVVNVALDIC